MIKRALCILITLSLISVVSVSSLAFASESNNDEISWVNASELFPIMNFL